MSGERSVIRASEFCSAVRDGTHDSPKSEPYGHKLITSRHLKNGRIHQHEAYAISDADYAAINKRSKVDKWDVLISMIGTIGEVCLVKEEAEFAIKNVGLFKTKSENDGKWLYYYLLTRDAQNRIAELSRGTTQQYLPLNALRDLPILCCDSLSEQSDVVSILSTLDDKIELNRKMNETLEQMARALFKSWFVDFDPVRAKMDGRTPTGMDAATAALFPDRLVDSELGLIPEGWEVKALGEIFQSRTERVGERILPEYSCSNSGVLPRSDKYKKQLSASLSNNRIVRRGDFVFGLSRAILNFGVMNDEVGCVSPAYKVLTVKNTEIHHEILYWMMLAWHDYYYGLVSGSSREGQSVSSDAFNQVYALIPTLGVQAQWLRIRETLAEQQSFLTIQSRTLSTLRDTLLPKLVSGEVRVGETQL